MASVVTEFLNMNDTEKISMVASPRFVEEWAFRIDAHGDFLMYHQDHQEFVVFSGEAPAFAAVLRRLGHVHGAVRDAGASSYLSSLQEREQIATQVALACHGKKTATWLGWGRLSGHVFARESLSRLVYKQHKCMHQIAHVATR